MDSRIESQRPHLMIVDGMSDMTQLLRDFLSTQSVGFCVVKTAQEGAERLSRESHDVLIVSDAIPGSSLAAFIPSVMANYPELRVILLHSGSPELRLTAPTKERFHRMDIPFSLQSLNALINRSAAKTG